MYQAQFCKLDGLDEEDIGTAVGLQADTQDAAEDEALSLSQPEGANFVKILDDGRRVAKLGFAL
jgi:hypothetical protein